MIDWLTIGLSMLGFILGGIFTYFLQYNLYKRKAKYDKRIELYEKIYDELYEFNLSLEMCKITTLKNISLIKSKGSWHRLGTFKKLIEEIHDSHKNLFLELHTLKENIKPVLPKFMDKMGFHVDEEGHFAYYLDIPDEIIFGFLTHKGGPKQIIVQQIIINFLWKNNKEHYEDLGISEEEDIVTYPSNQQIKKFNKIFKYRKFTKNSKNFNSEYHKLKRLMKEAMEKLKRHF